jgi:hypothetical protein
LAGYSDSSDDDFNSKTSKKPKARKVSTPGSFPPAGNISKKSNGLSRNNNISEPTAALQTRDRNPSKTYLPAKVSAPKKPSAWQKFFPEPDDWEAEDMEVPVIDCSHDNLYGDVETQSTQEQETEVDKQNPVDTVSIDLESSPRVHSSQDPWAGFKPSLGQYGGAQGSSSSKGQSVINDVKSKLQKQKRFKPTYK